MADELVPPAIAEMAELLSKHKLVPFLGAGVSRNQLRFAAAGLAREMALRLGLSADMMLCDVADAFVGGCGEAAFVKYLDEKLTLTEVDEHRTSTHRLVVSLMLNLVYTTNQDNIYELTACRLGRKYRRVVTVEDLSEAIPGEPLLIKFHGDPAMPASLVFGTRSYEERISATDHPLDIKLRADLLGKRLIFLGYSFQDENVRKLFAAVQRAFGGTLPPSYLVAYADDPALQATAAEYQVRVIVPAELFPDEPNNAKAFERCLKVLCDETLTRQGSAGLEALFTDQQLNPRVATEFEVDALERIIETGPASSALDFYRGRFDQTYVPEYLRDRVTGAFIALAEQTDATDEAGYGELQGALFNFNLPPAMALEATGAVMAAFNRRAQIPGYDHHCNILCPVLPDGYMSVAAAVAVTMLRDSGQQITDGFRRAARRWFDGLEKLDEPARQAVEVAIHEAWPGSLAGQSPLRTPRPTFSRPNFREIVDGMMKSFPQTMATPRE
jgi:hypothetical protein